MYTVQGTGTRNPSLEKKNSGSEGVIVWAAVLKIECIVCVRKLIIPRVDEVVKAPVGVGLPFPEKVAELHLVELIVTGADIVCRPRCGRR